MRKKKIVVIITATIAILFNLYSLYLHAKINFLSSGPKTLIATCCWLLSIIFWWLTIFLFPSSKKNSKRCFDTNEKFILFGILTLGLILRVYKINHLGIYLDEKYWLEEARNIISGFVKTPFGIIGDQPSNLPAFLVALLLLVFNNVYYAVRLPGVIYSLSTIFFVFSFLREAFNKRVAFLSAFFLATSLWDIHMSHYGWNNVNLNPFLISGTIFFLYRGIKYSSIKDIFWCSLFLGISLNLLYVASLSLETTLIYFFYQIILRRNRKIISLLLLLLISSSLFFSPTIIKIIKYPDLTVRRHGEFINDNLVRSRAESPFSYYLEQIKFGFADFLYQEERFSITQLWGATLDPVVSFFLWAGLIFAIFNVFKPHYFLILINFFIMFVPIVVLYRFSSIWREYGFLPTVYILSAIGIENFSYVINNFIHHLFPRISKLNCQKIIITLTISVYFFLLGQLYFHYYNFHLRRNVDIYESYCKKITEYLLNNLPLYSKVILPKELCKDLIIVVLEGKYDFSIYDSFTDISSAFQGNNFSLVYIDHHDSYLLPKISENDIELLLGREGKPYEKRIIKGDSGKIYAYIYISRD